MAGGAKRRRLPFTAPTWSLLPPSDRKVAQGGSRKALIIGFETVFALVRVLVCAEIFEALQGNLGPF